jgi:peptidoglycan/LPS O-acetylase OafA/YrhL
VRLSEYAVGRDNNFTLLRFSAAMTVLFAHSVAVLGLPPDREFFFHWLGFSLGEMGLDMLFVTSGFLVTASLVGRQDLIAFLWARILRVYPGIWVMLGLTVFVLAPALTTLPLRRLLRVALDVGIFPQMRDAHRRRALFAARRVRECAAQERVQRLAVDDAG